MRKRLTAAFIGAMLIPTNCFGAVVSLDDEYSVKVNNVEISGIAEKDDYIAYTVVKKGDDAGENANVRATGELVVDSEDGSFAIDFTLPENTTSGDYVVRVGWLGGAETKTKEIHFVNVSNAYLAIKNAETLNDMETIFAPESEHIEALVQLGYETDLLNEAVSEAGKKNVLTAFLNDTERETAKEEEQAEIFDKYLGLELINEGKEGGIEKINPSFGDEGKYSDITNASLKKYLSNGIYKRAEYESPEEIYKAYEVLNILYKINNAATGELSEIIEEYKEETAIEDEDYYKKFNSMTSIKKNRVASTYIEYADSEEVTTYEDFREIFEKAVKAITSEGGKESSGGGSGGGGGYTGGVTSVTTKLDESNGEEAETQKNIFTDIAEVSWAHEAIISLAEKGIINGTAPGKFEPQSNITREQFVKIIMLSIGETGINQSVPFEDVQKDEWYTQYVADAYNKGIVKGISDSEFGIGENITRQDLAVIAVRAAEASGKEITGRDETALFADSEEIANYAKEAVNALYSLGVVNGKEGNTFAPNDYCTRAEAAKIIYNLFFK